MSNCQPNTELQNFFLLLIILQFVPSCIVKAFNDCLCFPFLHFLLIRSCMPPTGLQWRVVFCIRSCWCAISFSHVWSQSIYYIFIQTYVQLFYCTKIPLNSANYENLMFKMFIVCFRELFSECLWNVTVM